MSKTLAELGEEYRQTARQQRELLSRCRNKLNMAIKAGLTKETARLEALTRLLYVQIRDLEENGAYLRSYYENSDTGAGNGVSYSPIKTNLNIIKGEENERCKYKNQG